GPAAQYFGGGGEEDRHDSWSGGWRWTDTELIASADLQRTFHRHCCSVSVLISHQLEDCFGEGCSHKLSSRTPDSVFALTNYRMAHDSARTFAQLPRTGLLSLREVAV